jgi:hypothetical protein
METPELFQIVDEKGLEHNAVGPPQGRDGLVAPLAEYFADSLLWKNVPKQPIAHWFSLKEQGKKDCIRRRAQERGAITGKKSREVHELFTRGAYSNAALVPWNMEVFYPTVHDQLQSHQLTIKHFDPLDISDMSVDGKRGVLIVFGLDGRIIKQEDLWIYHRAKWRQSKEDITALQQEIPAVRKTQWRIAERLKNIKECGGYIVGGYDDIYSLASNYGIASPQTKMLIRMAKFAEDTGLREMLEAVDIETADNLRKTPEEDLGEVLNWFTELPPAQAWENFNVKYPSKKTIPRFYVMPREPYKEVRANRIEEVEHNPNDMVIKGGRVVVGITEEVEDG